MIRDAMRGKAMVALGRVALAKRERVIMLQPWGKGLVGTTLRFVYEFCDAARYINDLPEISMPKTATSARPSIQRSISSPSPTTGSLPALNRRVLSAQILRRRRTVAKSGSR